MICARFARPWVVKEHDGGFAILDARGVYVCGLSHREDLHRSGYTMAERYLSREEARDLAMAISKIE